MKGGIPQTQDQRQRTKQDNWQHRAHGKKEVFFSTSEDENWQYDLT
jgi:hypothetical protein